MKTLSYILLTALSTACCTTSLFAGHWRVSNIPGASANFTSVQVAHDTSLLLPTDTLYIEPSGTSYGNLNWSKQLVIIGNGYYLAANPETQANTATSRFVTIIIYSGASSSLIIGCEIDNLYLQSGLSNIFIKRNKIGNLTPASSNNGSNIYIYQNVINSCQFMASYWTNLFIENNIISNLAQTSSNSSATIRNNILTSSGHIWNSTLVNNIQSGGSYDPANCNFHHNIGSSTQYGTDNGNLSNVNMADVFVCWLSCTAYSFDGRYQLKPGSVAAGAGEGSIDCGIFDGNYPYVLSGMPGVPAIYYLQLLPQGDLLNVSVKVKSHN